MAKQPKKYSIKKYLSRYKLPIFFYILLTLLFAAVSMFVSIVIADALVRITSTQFRQGVYALLIALGGGVATHLLYYLSCVIYTKYTHQIVSEMELDLSKQAFKLNSHTFNQHDTGTFVERIVEDPERVVWTLSSLVDNTINTIRHLAMLIYVSTINYILTLCLLAISGITLIIQLIRSSKRHKNRRAEMKERDRIVSLTTEIVRSEQDIKSLGLENKLSHIAEGHYNKYKKLRTKTMMTEFSLETLGQIFVNITTIAVGILGVALLDKGAVTMSAFVLLFENKDIVNWLASTVGYLLNDMVDIKISVNRMFSLFDEREYVTESFGTKQVDLSGNAKIEFKNVSFSYKDYHYSRDKRAKNKNQLDVQLVSEKVIFNNLNLKIEPNTTVAFVGKSGCGKSTILNLMAKMYTVDGGEVLLGDVNINEFSRESLRGNISLVNQFPYIFDMSIKNNLLLVKENATEEEIQNALQKASLLEFVETLPKGIDTRVGESGVKLSGGQRQRLAIARALLRNSNIIIFDESTSSLDNFAQGEVKKSIDMLKGQTTVVIAAHRLSTIRDVDKIFFMEDGKIVDTGTFDQLYNKNKKFKDMFEAENLED